MPGCKIIRYLRTMNDTQMEQHDDEMQEGETKAPLEVEDGTPARTDDGVSA